MRLYLSSFRLGNRPEELTKLLKGGTKAAVIVNAADHLSPVDRDAAYQREVANLTALCITSTEVDLRIYFGKQEQLREELQKYDLVWVRGGNAFILRRACKYSGADEVIKDLLEQDAIVYGGYSAGIDQLTPSFHGIELVDDPNIIPEGYEKEIIWEGLNILPYSVAPHYKSNHPESADIDKSVTYLIDNHMLFKALRDGEVIIRNGDEEYIID